MAKYGQADFIFKIDVSDGGTLTSMNAYVDTFAGLKIRRLTEQSDTFGDSWEEHLLAGIRRMEPFTVGGFYDDTASTGPDVVFNTSTHTVTRTVELTWGSTKTSTFEAWIVGYDRVAQRGKLTRWEATIQPTGAITEA